MTYGAPPPPPPPSYGGPVGPAGYGFPPAAPRSNGPAIASLILGILGCVPFLTSIVAIILGVIGLRKTRDPAVGGKGLAIAGLILGLIGILGWSVISAVGTYGYIASKPVRVAAVQYIHDLSSGNIQEAASHSSGITSAELQQQIIEVQGYGSFTSSTFSAASINFINGQTTAHLGGAVIFSNGPKACVVDLVKVGATYKVTKITFQ